MTAGKVIVPEPGKKTPLGELTVVLVDHINSDYNGTYTYFEILNGDSAFPMAFFCPNWFELAAVCKLAEFLQAIIGLPPHQQMAQVDRLCKLESCRRTLTKEWTYWGIRNGRGEVEFISGKWPDTYPFVAQLSNPWYKSCPTMAEAIKWMLFRGCTAEELECHEADMADFVNGVSNINILPLAPSTPKQAHGQSNSTFTPSPAKPPSCSGTTPSCPAAHSAGLNFDVSSYYNRQPAPAQDTPSRNSSRDTTDGEVKKSSTKKSKHSGTRTAHDAQASNDNGKCSRPRVKTERLGAFDHVLSIHKRNSKGHVRATLFITPAPSENQVPSLGRYIDNFVDVYGFPDLFIVGIHTGWLSSTTLDEFMLAILHMATTEEARFMWRWIDIPVNHATRSCFV
ncbi:hypothetical protein BC835DRAFT_1423758 [Cytidiella melzeri]|nr:hypothetical protein BC835DRAFT_1423758 [Cytidiella melzeri]